MYFSSVTLIEILCWLYRTGCGTCLGLVHFDEAAVNLRPRRDATDAPQLIGVFGKRSSFDRVDVIDASQKHVVVTEVVQKLRLEKSGRFDLGMR
jgi:hypothetical protein